MNPSISFDGRHFGRDHSRFMIAELFDNPNGDLDQALRIIDAAVDAGADALKIQTYTPDTMTIDCDASDFHVRRGLWDGRKLYDLYQEAHTPWERHEALFAHARKLGTLCFRPPSTSPLRTYLMS